MQTKISGFYLFENKFYSVDIFGYSTQGLPGIEIIGIGQRGRSVKEKFVYLGKERLLPMPLRRYVLCIENFQHQSKKNVEIEWLELPLLLVFWFLCKYLPLHSLNNCFSSGQISVHGQIIVPSFPSNGIAHSLDFKRMRYIGLYENSKNLDLGHYLDIKELFEHIPDLNFLLAKDQCSSKVMLSTKCP